MGQHPVGVAIEGIANARRLVPIGGSWYARCIQQAQRDDAGLRFANAGIVKKHGEWLGGQSQHKLCR